MGVLYEVLTVVWLIAFAGFGLATVYHLIMGGLQKDKRQLTRGLMCLAAFAACAFIGVLILSQFIQGMC